MQTPQLREFGTLTTENFYTAAHILEVPGSCFNPNIYNARLLSVLEILSQ